MVQPKSGNYIETRGRLRFLSRGDRRYLTEIRFAGSSMHSIPVVRRELARELVTNQQTASTVELAMK